MHTKSRDKQTFIIKPKCVGYMCLSEINLEILQCMQFYTLISKQIFIGMKLTKHTKLIILK